VKIEVTLIERYDVKINGDSVGEFKKESEWNGMSDLVMGNESIVVDGLEEGIFDNMFKGVTNNKTKKCNVVKISPGLIPDKIE